MIEKLPPELRCVIYKHLLTANHHLGHAVFPLVPDLRRRGCYKIHVAILRASKAIHREAVLILYGDNTFLYQSTDNYGWQKLLTQSLDSIQRLRLGRTRCEIMKALERGPADTYLYSISHLELYFGNTTISREVDSAVKLVRKLAKRPNQLKTLKLELWHGIRTVKNEIDILKRLEQVKVSRRLTLVVWYTRTDEVDFGRLKQWQATSMGEGAYAVESASVETDETMWEVYPLCTRMQWVLVPKSS